MLGVLQMEAKRVKLVAEGEMGDGNRVSTTTTDEGNVVDKTDHPQAPVNNALEILVRNATEEFGFAPRDVYDGVFNLPATKEEQAAVVGRFDYSKLPAIVGDFSACRALYDLSHRVVAVWPRKAHGSHVEWAIDFKSKRIAKMVVNSMRSATDKHILQTYGILYKTPTSSPMVGWVFGAFAHHMFITGCHSAESLPEATRMVSNDLDPPTFSAGPSPLPISSLSIPPPVRTSTRVATQVDIPFDLSDVTLSGDKYYIPVATNDSPFDSFTVDHDLDDRTIVMSIFQMTTSPMHEGSALGYPYIQRVVTHVRELLNRARLEATVDVAYFLACPKRIEPENQWKMPFGLGASAKENNDHGDVFCLRFPGTSCVHSFPILRPS